MIEELAARAVDRWPVSVADIGFVAARENVIFKVTSRDGQAFALRAHRPGYRSDVAIASELEWMAALADGGIAVPRPLASRAGRLVETVDGRRFDMLSWLAGASMGKTGALLNLTDRAGTFHGLGCEMARIHAISDRFAPSPEFSVPRWDAGGLIGDQPLWDRFWLNPALDNDQRRTLLTVRDRARERLDALADRLDFGLIHADLVRENVLVDGDAIGIIDFGDCGYGYRLFDIATALLKNRREHDFNELAAALLAGYRSLRPIDTTELPLFLALRSLTYVGWIISRLDEDNSAARNARNIAVAVALSEAYLAS